MIELPLFMLATLLGAAMVDRPRYSRPGTNVPRDPDQEARLIERTRKTLEAEPAKAQLHRRLLSLGGDHAVLWVHEPDLYPILDRAQARGGERAELIPGEPSQCHANAASLWARDPDRFQLETGYALSDDGLWRQHSWVYDLEDSQVVETTVPRVLYYGFRLTDEEAGEFAEAQGLERRPLQAQLGEEGHWDHPDAVRPRGLSFRIVSVADDEYAEHDEDNEGWLYVDEADELLRRNIGISSYETTYEAAVDKDGDVLGASTLGRRQLDWDGDEPVEELSFSVVVHPDFRRQGVGRALVQSILDANPSAMIRPWVVNPHMALLLEDMGFSAEGRDGEWSEDAPHMSYP